MSKLTQLLVDPKSLAEIREGEIPDVIGALESTKVKLLSRFLGQSDHHAEAQKQGERLLTVPEAAKKLQLTEQYVYGLIRQRQLTAVIVGRYKRLRESDLVAWISRQSS